METFMLTAAQQAIRQRFLDRAAADYDPNDPAYTQDDYDEVLFHQYAGHIINRYYTETPKRITLFSWTANVCPSDPTLLHQLIYLDVTVDCYLNEDGEKVLRATKSGQLVCENRLSEFSINRQ